MRNCTMAAVGTGWVALTAVVLLGPQDAEYYCTGCSLQTLWLIGQLMSAPAD